MSTPFRDSVGPAAAERLFAEVQAACPTFDLSRARAALPPLDALALKARVEAIATALRAGLPADWPAALAGLLAALPPPLPGTTGVGSLFYLWPVLTVVEVHGGSHPTESLAALGALTRRFSAEFAVRPYLRDHPSTAWAAVEAWADDPCPHVRRLASEGTRPRLPWGMRLPVGDSQRHFALLHRLIDDPSPYVRRSVANHLGDLAKEDRRAAIAAAAAWLAEDPRRAPVLRHGLRGPLKAGDPAALALFGHAPAGVHVRAAQVRPAEVSVGEDVVLEAILEVDAPALVRVDVVWEWPGARGGWSRRTFVGGSAALVPGVPWHFRWPLRLRPVTTRPLRPGPQRLLLRVQGVERATVSFALRAP